MRQSTADRLKAEATRALLTCQCGHTQTDHLHQMRDGWVVGLWKQCLTQGCRCQGFQSILSAREKTQLDGICDRKVEAQTLASVLRNQVIPTNVTIPVLRYDSQKAVRVKKRGKADPRVRVQPQSAPNAGISGMYRNGVATKTAKGKYLWEE